MIPLPQIDSCDGCGACCTGQAALPIHMVGITKLPGCKKLPDWLRDELKATMARMIKDGFPPDGSPCIWYDADKRQCKHYEYRPELCRDGVKVGDEACRRWRRTAGIDPPGKRRLVRGKLVQA